MLKTRSHSACQAIIPRAQNTARFRIWKSPGVHRCALQNQAQQPTRTEDVNADNVVCWIQIHVRMARPFQTQTPNIATLNGFSNRCFSNTSKITATEAESSALNGM